MGVSVAFVAIYLLGGLTFLPLVLAFLLLHAYFTFPVRPVDRHNFTSASLHSLRGTHEDDRKLHSTTSAANIAEKFHRKHEPDVAAGYFAVCREYVPGGINGKPPERTTPAGEVVATESPSVYQSMYRSLFDRRQVSSLDPNKGNGKTVKRTRNLFYVVLRHGHLMLYEDSEQIEVKHVISLELHDVSIYGGENVIPEGEIWIKRNAIRLSRKQGIEDPPTSTSKPFFLFSENCSDKEDFYFALLHSQDVRSKSLDTSPKPQLYETKHIINLVQKLHSSEEHLQTRWINGLVGRLFLALYKTRSIEDFVRQKITKKIARVKKPAFLSGIILQRIEMGESAPRITNPRLKDLTIDGDCCAEADFEYNGNFRLEVAATARIDLGARFKTREVNLVLAVVIKKLTGHALVKFKPPPSNRVWITFETMPDMEMAIEPIVSSRQITYGIILRAIESRIREVMAETIVMPHWDDSPFTNTASEKYRGGIWADNMPSIHRTPEHTHIPDEAPEDEAEIESEPSAVPQNSMQAKDESPMTSPILLDEIAVDHGMEVATEQLRNASASTEGGISTGIQKHSEPPKALRSRSFASAANPLLSTDNANVGSSSIEQKGKKQQDATSAMMAISNRPRPTSPSEAPDGPAFEPPSLWSTSRSPSNTFPSDSKSKIFNGKNRLTADTSENPIQSSLPSTPTTTSSRSIKSAFGPDQPGTVNVHEDDHNLSAVGKRQSTTTLGAASVAAKNWGWGVFNRNTSQRYQNDHGQDRSKKSLNEPMGRGRPLPPPGQPLPFPEGVRSKGTTSMNTKRKPVGTPSLPQHRQAIVRVNSDTPPQLPARRRKSPESHEDHGSGSLLVIEAPPSSEPSSEEDEMPDVEGQLAADEAAAAREPKTSGESK